ncbi:universal stress protein [Desulfoplanes formicivorans]|uniref:Universal stress protein n=1 Tax=Desulfoplanes formicivorans TaxID=1592317 RepID=A0A194AG22_9BACT|nr:universal stress protein [Desulfoplanes formicivorans]GAU08155.1 universal stress protein [Desulfoplanes formicivorans]
MKRFKNILYVTETTVNQASALAQAVSLAENNLADMTVMDVIPPQGMMAGMDLPAGGPMAESLSTPVESHRRKKLEAMIRPFSERLHVRLKVLVGKPYLEAIQAVVQTGHDLLIKPAENPGWTRRLFGSDDLHLLRKCPCPVWLIKPTAKQNNNCILAAVDFPPAASGSAENDLNREILELAASLALANFASLHIVHAWEALGGKTILSRGSTSSEGLGHYIEREHDRHRQELDRLAGQLREWVGSEAYDYLAPVFHLPEGAPKKVIPPLAKGLRADLVVMGTAARTGISGLIMGNTAEAILDQLTCSVLAIKPPGFTPPVKLTR